MTCTLVATAKSQFANSYATVDEASAYFANQLRTEVWDATTAIDKCRALVSATILLDHWVIWDGHSTTFDQRLAWPRYGLYTVTGDPVDMDTIPDAIIAATAEMAKVLLTEDVMVRSAQVNDGLVGLRAGPVSLQWASRAQLPIVEKILPPSVWGLIQSWTLGKTGGSSFAVNLIRA